MNREEKRKMIKANTSASSKCPKCNKVSLFAIDANGYARCILCSEIVSEKKFNNQGFVKL